MRRIQGHGHHGIIIEFTRQEDGVRSCNHAFRAGRQCTRKGPGLTCAGGRGHAGGTGSGLTCNTFPGLGSIGRDALP
jgi:hypothetical protein